jgi:Flp pilus assembly protein TadG
MMRPDAIESKSSCGEPSTRRGRERGFTSVELAIVAPVLLALIFSIVHIGMLFHTRNAANDVADATLREAQRQESTAPRAKAVGSAMATKYGTSLNHTTITVTRTGTDATVVVVSDGIRIVPFLPVHITRTVSGPVERFISEADRRTK